MDKLNATVHSARDGSAEALDRLFAAHLGALVGFIRVRAGGIVAARESAHDLAQSVCREAIIDLDRFDFESTEAFGRWLRARALRKICNRARFHGRDARDPQREVRQDGSTVSPAEVLQAYATLTTPSRHASAREELDRIEGVLAELPDEQREAVAMTRIAGLSYAEAATVLGCTESAVRGLVMRGLTRLSSLLHRQSDTGSDAAGADITEHES